MKNHEKSLLEQLEINEMEIEGRKQLFMIDENTCDEMIIARNQISMLLDNILDEFFRNLTSTSDARSFISDSDTLVRLKHAQGKYILELFSGNYDAEYSNSRLRVGLVHKRIGISLSLFLGGVKILSDIIRDVLPKQSYDAFERVVYFDNSLIFDAYLHIHSHKLIAEKEKAIEFAEKISERSKELEEIAKKDPLTSLLNVRALNTTLASEIKRSKRTQQSLCVLYIDIDKFKIINDTYGHDVGDEVLVKTSELMRLNTRETDYLFRCGGDEFCVIAINTIHSDAEILAQKLIDEFVKFYTDYSLSIGISEFQPDMDKNPNEIMREADRKMYISKNSRNPRLKLYTGTND